MKKILNLILGALCIVLLNSTSAFASESIDIHIDGYKVKSKSGIENNQNDIDKYYMDVSPQLKEHRVYIPISTITNFLGADISWDRPTVKINYDNNELILKIGSKEAIKNGKTIRLEKEPYIYKGRTMVPLRFVSESLGLTVNYRDKKVDIVTPKLKINNIEIDSIDYYYHMTMGGVLSKKKNNLYINRMNDVFKACKTNEIDTTKLSESWTKWVDGPKYWNEVAQYMFLDKSNNKIAEYKMYECPDWSDINNPKIICLMEDVTNSKWYIIKTQDFKKIQDLDGIGEWTVISNTVA